jgi:hypothetical protein
MSGPRKRRESSMIEGEKVRKRGTVLLLSCFDDEESDAK